MMLYLRNDSMGTAAISDLCAVDGVKGVKWATPNPLKLAEAKAACDPSIVWVCGLAAARSSKAAKAVDKQMLIIAITPFLWSTVGNIQCTACT